MGGGFLIMKKEQYDEPSMKILCFDGEDVIRTSDNWTEIVGEDVF